jgi:rsbT co-antagonist protein RsbR
LLPEAHLVHALTEINTEKDRLIQHWIDEIDRSSETSYSKIIGRQGLVDFLEALLEDIKDQHPDCWDKVTNQEATRLASLGVNEDIFRVVLGSLTEVLWAYSMKKWADWPERALIFLREANILIVRGRTKMAGVFLDRRLEMIKKQQEAISELSTPVIPLLDNILIVPLIGTIDTTRANQIMENILYGITKRNAEIVIIDITGVHIVDSTVAQHLIKSYQASGLLGAKSILVGMRPEVAQTIVQLDIDFEEVETRNTLAQGIEYALQLQGKRIVDVPINRVN